MGKKTARLFTSVVLAASLSLCMSACGSSTKNSSSTGNSFEISANVSTAMSSQVSSEATNGTLSSTSDIGSASDAQTKTHTVTYYDIDGTTVLDTEEVEDDGTITKTEGNKDGYTFIAWYISPKMTRKFNVDEKIHEDKKLYGGFAKYTEDTREFAILGDGDSDVLKESAWGKVIGDAQKMTKEDNSEANVYTITVDLKEGDQFQFAMDSSWGDQRGYGYLTTDTIDGTQYLQKEGGLGKTSAQKSNIGVLVSGNNTFTLTTYPDSDTYDTEDPEYKEENKENFNYNPYDSITFTYNGESK